MQIINRNNNHSYLAIPLKLKNCSSSNLHITIKYFGDAKIDARKVRQIVEGYAINDGFFDLTWAPMKFGDNYVLEILWLHKKYIYLREEFALIKDDYPKWRPHITVPEVYWNYVVNNALQFKDEFSEIHIETLHLGTSAQ